MTEPRQSVHDPRWTMTRGERPTKSGSGGTVSLHGRVPVIEVGPAVREAVEALIAQAVGPAVTRLTAGEVDLIARAVFDALNGGGDD